MKNSRISTIRFEVISQLRLPMIILVTFAHSYGGVEEGYSLLASEWNTYEFLKLLVSQTLVKVAMPVFFIISGYLFFANVVQWNANVYKQKMLRRFKTLLIPYLIWNMLMAIKLKTFSWSMLWVYWKPAGIQTDWFGQEQLMTAPANMPLWFLRDLIVVLLLTPILYILIRKLGYWLMVVLTVLYLSGVCAFIPGLSAYAVYFFTFGAILSIRKMDLVVSLKHVEIPAYVLSILLAISMLLTYGTSVFATLMLCFRLMGAVSVFCLASRILSSTNRRLPSVICDSAYFIYLAHFVFFFSFIDTTFFALLGTSIPVLSFHYLLTPLLKAALLITIYCFYRKLQRYKWEFCFTDFLTRFLSGRK